MTSSKRRRELARAKAERQASRRQESSQRRRRRNQIIAVLAVLLVVGGGIAWYVASRPTEAPIDAAVPTESPAPTDAPVPTDSPAPSDSAAPTDAPSPTDSTGPQPDSACQEAPPARSDNMSWDAAPAEALEPGKDYTLTLATNCGDIVIATEPQKAPITVNSMVFLANEGYFDLTACHRLTTEGIFVLQCGDPAGNGTGGPGYSIPDENLPPEGTANYPAGTVAMANAGPGTGGSQFFIVYEDTTLPSGYTIWGRVAEGLDVVKGIAAAGVEGGGSDGAPAQKVTIITAEVTPA
ncbi:MAG: peptidylprolyl isomerase [Actinomycetota bacterium]